MSNEVQSMRNGRAAALVAAISLSAGMGDAKPLPRPDPFPTGGLEQGEVVLSSPRPAPRAILATKTPPEALMPETADAASNTGSEPFDVWAVRFRDRALSAGVPSSTVEGALYGVRPVPKVIERDRNQSEFTKALWDYLDTAVSDARIRNGRAALRAHADTLEAVERRWGVEKEIVAAVWGLESAYGAVRGSDPVIASLATLAHEGRRQAFFEEQLLAALQILAAGDTTSDRMRGSWAGAMGHTQFMPTSFLEFAVDHDGDGRRDIWGDDPTDALASTAAYLSRHGWTAGRPWGFEIRLPDGFDYASAGERIKKTAAEWTALGVRDADGEPLADHGPMSVLLPAGHAGVALAITSNFHVLERYNTADAYVIGVGHLSDRLRGGGPFRAVWPREDRALFRAERVELQRRLTAAGFDTLGVDGRIGPNTQEAVRHFQRARGMVPDGYASLVVLARLRGS
jgi:membrane-bound lytic murein transglycosylase B